MFLFKYIKTLKNKYITLNMKNIIINLKLVSLFEILFINELFKILIGNDLDVSKLDNKDLYQLNYLLRYQVKYFKARFKNLNLDSLNKSDSISENIILISSLNYKIINEDIYTTLPSYLEPQRTIGKVFPFELPTLLEPNILDSELLINNFLKDFLELYKELLILWVMTNRLVRYKYTSNPIILNMGPKWLYKHLEDRYIDKFVNDPSFDMYLLPIKDLSKSKSYKDFTLKNVVNKEISDKPLQLRYHNRIKLYEHKEFKDKPTLMIAKFSNSQIIKDKKINKKILINEHIGSSLSNDPGFNSLINLEKQKNLRENLSVIASIVFTNPSTKDAILDTFNSNLIDERSLDWIRYSQAMTELSKGKIDNIFIIDKYSLYTEFYFKNKKYFDFQKYEILEKRISINTLNLYKFSKLFASLYHEKKKISNSLSKILINEGIDINEDFMLDSDYINAYFSKLFNYKNSIFLFYNISWSEVLENFYKYGIEISGGSTVKRHLINPMDFSISNFINTFSHEPYHDIVQSTHLLEESLYKSQISKSIENEYHKNILSNYISSEVSILGNTYSPMINMYFKDGEKYYTDITLETRSLFYNYLLNYWILRFEENNSDNNIIFSSLETLLISQIKELELSKNYKNNTLNNKEKKLIKFYHYIKDFYQNNDIRYFSTLIPNKNYKLSALASKRGLNAYPAFPIRGTLYTLNRFNFIRVRPINIIGNSNSLKYSTLNNNNNPLGTSIVEVKESKKSKVNMKNSFNKIISDLINNSNLDPISIQKKLEENLIALLLEKMENDKDILISHNKEYYLKALNSFFTPQFQKELQVLVGKDLIEMYLNPSFVFLTLSIIIEGFTKKSHTMLGNITGFNIIRQLYINNKIYKMEMKITFKEFNLILSKYPHLLIDILKYKENPYMLNEIMNKIKDEEEEQDLYEDDNIFQTRLGLIFINLFLGEFVNLFKLDYKIAKNNRKYTDKDIPLYLVLTEDSKHKIELIRENLIIIPNKLPMVCEPLEWGKGKYGGFLINEHLKEDVITGSITYHNHSLSGKGKSKLFKTINYLNKIKFGINNSLLSFLKNEGSYIINNMVGEELINSKISINIAEIYKNIPFYLNTHADWRGRIYTHSFYLSYQGSEIATALLEFWEGYPLNDKGKYYFYASGACFYKSELNKKIMSDRVNWVKENIGEILKMEPDFIMKADSPLLFASFCLEMQKLDKDPNVKIHYPVYIDATCSGIQHLSAMFMDSEIAKLVNLIYDINDPNPKDFYQELVKPINEAINNEGKNNKEFSALEFLYLSRKELKAPIMTQNYNVSIFGMKDQLLNSLKVPVPYKEDSHIKENKYKILGKSHNGEIIELTNKDLIKIAMIIKNVIYSEFPVLQEIYNYFISLAEIMQYLKLSFKWLTPTGAIITQDYKKSIATKLRLNMDKQIKVKVLKIKSKDTDYLKQKGGIIPNVIHSLDSSHIINLICDLPLEFESPIVTVHDCFGTHPNFIEILDFRLKEEFISLYINKKFINLFQKRIIQHIKDNNYDVFKEKNNYYVILPNKEKLKIPKPPIKNNLDLKSIMKSKYMFN